jgi:hypothetical protein
MEVTLWNQQEDGTREEKTVDGFYHEPTPMDCINALVYDIRGNKSEWELAYVNSIDPAEESNE